MIPTASAVLEQQHQAFGNHVHDAGDRHPQRLGQIARLRELADQQQDRGGDEHPRDAAKDHVDSGAQLGRREHEPSSFGGEPPAVRGFTDDFGELPAATRDDPRARQQRAALALRHRLRLTREQRLVDLEVVARQDHAVDHDLITPADLDDVAFDDVARRHLARALCSHHGRGGPADDDQTGRACASPGLPARSRPSC